MADANLDRHDGGDFSIAVLVVDDNPLNRALVEAILEKLGVRSVSADGGAAAVELARAQACDLIIMDSRMPGVDGDEATRQIREAGASRQALILRWTTEGEVRLNAALYDGDLPKPLTCPPLVAALSLATRRARNRADLAGERSSSDGDAPVWTH